MSDLELQFRDGAYWRCDARSNERSGPLCPKCFEENGTISEMYWQEDVNGWGHFAYFRSYTCSVCDHSVGF